MLTEKIKAVIFDFDGVVCNTDIYHYKSWEIIAKRLSIPFNQSINDKLRGKTRMQSLEILLGDDYYKYSQKDKEELYDEKNQLFIKLVSSISRNDLAPDIIWTLNKLKSKGIKIAIGSSSKNASFLLTKLGIVSLFDVVVDGNSIKNSKPNPEVFMNVSKSLELVQNIAWWLKTL